jgi:hypothetical protein
MQPNDPAVTILNTDANAARQASQADQPKGGNQLERLLDGTFANLTFQNKGGASPEVRRTKIRKISLQRMDGLSAAWGKPFQEVKLYLDVADDATIDQLTEDSFSLVLEEGRRLNFTSFEKWYAWEIQAGMTLTNAAKETATRTQAETAEAIRAGTAVRSRP